MSRRWLEHGWRRDHWHETKTRDCFTWIGSAKHVPGTRQTHVIGSRELEARNGMYWQPCDLERLFVDSQLYFSWMCRATYICVAKYHTSSMDICTTVGIYSPFSRGRRNESRSMSEWPLRSPSVIKNIQSSYASVEPIVINFQPRLYNRFIWLSG